MKARAFLIHYRRGVTVTFPEPTPAIVRRSRRLGVVAFVIALVALVGSLIISIILGVDFAQADASLDFTSAMSKISAVAGVLALLEIILGSLLGIWAIVQGIIAAVQRRGRAWGVTAIVLAVVAPGIALAAFILSNAMTTSATN